MAGIRKTYTLFVETRRETLALSVKTIYNLCETKYPV